MTTMIAEVYDALIEAGASQAKARKAAEAIVAAEDVATKADLRETEGRLRTEIRELELPLVEWVIGVGAGSVAALAGLMFTFVRTLPHS